MTSRRSFSWVALGLLGLVFVLVFARVMEMRFTSGNTYPYYSSFRSDPLGSLALYESLESMEGLTVERNLRHLNSIKGLEGDSTLLMLGLGWSRFGDIRVPEDSAVIEAVEKKGARLVITLNPVYVPREFDPYEKDWMDKREELKKETKKEKSNDSSEEESNSEEEKESESEKKAENAGSKDDEDSSDKTTIPKLSDVIGLKIVEPADKYTRPEEGWSTRPGKDGKDHLSALPLWHSPYSLKGRKDHPWKAMVVSRKKPVVMERTFGKGTIVVATDSYFTSNEALHLGGDPEFLSWLMGGHSHIVFDETIHGSTKSGGIMTLIRRYRLHGFFLGMFLFIGLWAWRSASSLAPGDEEVERGLIAGEAVAGEQSSQGLIRLLQRSIARNDLIEECVRVWKNSQPASLRLSEEKEQKLNAMVGQNKTDPKKHGVLESYRAISQLLKKR